MPEEDTNSGQSDESNSDNSTETSENGQQESQTDESDGGFGPMHYDQVRKSIRTPGSNKSGDSRE